MRKLVREPGQYFPPMLHILHILGSRNSGLWDSELDGSSDLGHCLVLSLSLDPLEGHKSYCKI